MKIWEIWSEGYMVTGNTGKHQLMGEAEGKTFRQACINLAKKDSEFSAYFEEEDLSHWGCSLFPTAEEAAKTFG